MRVASSWRARVLALAIPFASACGASDEPVEQDSWGAACDPRPGEDVEGGVDFLDLEVSARGLVGLDGLPARLITYTLDDPERIYGAAEAEVEGGTFGAAWADGYRRFEYQIVVAYVDADDSGRCERDEPGVRFVTNAWNPVGDQPLVQDLTVFPLEPTSEEVCADINRCGR